MRKLVEDLVSDVRRIAVTSMAATGLLLGGSILAGPAHAGELGGLDLVRVCKAQNGNDAWWVPELVPPRGPYNWRCYNDRIHQARGIDMNGGCRILYGNGAYARLLDSGNPYAWRCWR
ncbi:hypothetical protein V7968_26050 [Nocardia vulneris]|uniref:hypothetical protein n=1 Tax=Nocardia vulneris TaxID=1141657 RepID=UPI0030D5B8BB